MTLNSVCVVGGGMIGSAVALGLAQKGISVSIIEKKMPKAFSPEQAPDLRVSALNIASENFLQQLGAWSNILNMRHCRYGKLSVWENTNCRIDFDCQDAGYDHLGYFVENRLIQLGIHQALNEYSNVKWIESKHITSLDLTTNTLKFEDNSECNADLIVGADGGCSQVRELVNIGNVGWQYEQHAMGIVIHCPSQASDQTWQQFTPHGPMAFLPMYDGYASLIWYGNAALIKQLKGLDDTSLKNRIINEFPDDLLADFEIKGKASFPLTRMHANQYYRDNVVILGDAAHTINPLAGQGVNLGFRDAQCLIEFLTNDENKSTNDVLAHRLKQYQNVRRKENYLMMSAMDGLYGLFSNDVPPVKAIRNIVLSLANIAGPVKNKVMKYAMGL